jgi:DNA ligase-1
MITERDMMHGRNYSGQDVSGWLMSEKLNGCRAYWDGSVMWTRGGKVIDIPAAMREALPVGIALDGEIHAGHGGFEVARQAVQYGRWVDGIEFSVFDAPSARLFEQRHQFVVSLLPPKGIVNFVFHHFCADISDAINYMRTIQADGLGEGVVLRDPTDIYAPGRSFGILKLKVMP